MQNLIADIGLLALGFALLILDLLLLRTGPRRMVALFHAAWSGLALILLAMFGFPFTGAAEWAGVYHLDQTGWTLRVMLVASALLTVLLSRPYFRGGANGQPPLRSYAEFLYLLIFASVGMCAAISARELITLFVGLELATIPLYVLSAYDKHRTTSAEAGAKFILFGSVSTAFMLMGCSYLYGVAGSVHFDAIGAFIAAQPDHPLIWAGVFFMLGAAGFKIGLFPFHMWVPDVYAGAPTPVTAFLSVSSKLTGLAVLGTLVFGPFAGLAPRLVPCLLLLSGASMVVGNLGALRQNDFRRFMGYSSIAQGGFFLLAFAGTPTLGTTALLTYLAIYGVSNYTAFFVFASVGERRGERLDALRGLSHESPGLAAVLALSMFSLAGIPPAAGFTGKFLLYAAAAEQRHYAFVIFAALNAAVSLYYYLQVIRQAYIIPPETPPPPLSRLTPARVALLAALALAILLLGLVSIA